MSTINTLVSQKAKTGTKLEVCIDSLESALNAIQGGVTELEVCSSLVEGGLTPSPGLVIEILNAVNSIRKENKAVEDKTDSRASLELKNVPKINVMIRCRGGSDFCYTENEMATMIADIQHYKTIGVDSFVFGALTDQQDVDEEKCARIISEAHPLPVTFHRAFDLCSNPKVCIEKIIRLGFKRLLTSGQRLSAADSEAIQLIKYLQDNFGNVIEIMPGAGVTVKNVKEFVELGCQIVHSSCKVEKETVTVVNDLGMGSCKMFETSKDVVCHMVKILSENCR